MERTSWILALLVLAVLVCFGMWRGWANRARRQSGWLPAFPAVPPDSGADVLPECSGLYVGTTTAGDWQDRIAVGDIGHRAETVAALRHGGLLLERAGSTPMWIPVEAMRDARIDQKLANKVMPGVGMLVVTWQLGDHLLDTGFRSDDKATQNEWANAIRELVPATASNESARTRQEEQ